MKVNTANRSLTRHGSQDLYNYGQGNVSKLFKLVVRHDIHVSSMQHKYGHLSTREIK